MSRIKNNMIGKFYQLKFQKEAKCQNRIHNLILAVDLSPLNRGILKIGRQQENKDQEVKLSFRHKKEIFS